MWRKNLLREAVVFLKRKFSISSFPIFWAFLPDSLILEYSLYGFGEKMGSRISRNPHLSLLRVLVVLLALSAFTLSPILINSL